MKEKERGVTLVALAVTIVVLLIIAGVSIGIATNNNGVIKKVQNTSSRFETNKNDLSNSLDTLYDKLSGGVKNLTSTVIRIIPSTTEWTNQNVKITISKIATDYSIQYSTDGTSWKEYNNEAVIVDKNLTITARLYKGAELGNTASYKVTNIDKRPPTTTAPTYVASTNEISVTNNQKDKEKNAENGCSGIATIEYGIKGM